MSEALDRLTQEVASTTALEASAVALITGIAAQLRDAAGNEAAVNALADQLEQGAGPLAQAVTTNTPAAAQPAADATASAGADTTSGGDAGAATSGADTAGAGGDSAGGDAGAGTGTADTSGAGAATTGEGGGEPTT